VTLARFVGAATASMVLVTTPVARAEPDAGFADQLMRERDYFRAITVFKELLYRETDPSKRAGFQLKIGAAYRFSGRYELANDALLRVGTAAFPADAKVLARADAEIGLNYLGLDVLPLAKVYLSRADAAERTSVSRLGLASLDLRGGSYGAAAEKARAAAAIARDSREHGVATSVEEAAAKLARAPQKSPLVAGLLSGVIPGAGQAYVGHWVDGAQAAGFVGAFGFASFLAYRNDRDRGNPYVLTSVALSLTAVFYAANIVGAVRAARYANLRTAELLLLGPARDVLRLPVP
jgi:hypothetical protein